MPHKHPQTSSSGAAHATASAPPQLLAEGRGFTPPYHSRQSHPGFCKEESRPMASAVNYPPAPVKEPTTQINTKPGPVDPTGRPRSPQGFGASEATAATEVTACNLTNSSCLNKLIMLSLFSLCIFYKYFSVLRSVI